MKRVGGERRARENNSEANPSAAVGQGSRDSKALVGALACAGVNKWKNQWAQVDEAAQQGI